MLNMLAIFDQAKYETLNPIIIVLLLVVGLVMIIKGGDWFVDAASWFAEVTGIPKLIVGATIVSIATTLPEMLVSVFSAAQGEVSLSVGNAVGSVTANIGLIMALSLIFMPAVIKRKDYMLKSCLMLGAAILTAIAGFTGSVNVVVSILLMVIFVVFMSDNIIHAVKDSKNSNEEKEEIPKDKKTVIKNSILFVVGATCIVFGAEFLVDSGVALGDLYGGESLKRILGVTVVAIGTSLPELVTTLTAIRKKESSLSVGNIIGANVMDLTLIMPLSSLIYGGPLPISGKTAMFLDLPACLIVGAIALVPTLINKKFSRWQGFALLGVYTVYIVFTCGGFLG